MALPAGAAARESWEVRRSRITRLAARAAAGDFWTAAVLDLGATLDHLPGTEPLTFRLPAPVYRCFPLLELASDLADTLAQYERGLVNHTTVRQAAVAVAREAALVWLTTCAGELSELSEIEAEGDATHGT